MDVGHVRLTALAASLQRGENRSSIGASVEKPRFREPARWQTPPGEGSSVLMYGGYIRIFRSRFADRAAMNQDNSGLGCLLMVIAPILLLVSTYLAWWELRFLVQGRAAVATVEGVQEIDVGRRWYLYPARYLEVRYAFKDEATDRVRAEHDNLPVTWPRPDQTVRIQYVAGVPGGSRVEGHRHIWFTLFFVVCFVGSVAYGGFLLREARRAVIEEEAFEAARRRRAEG